MGEIELEAVGQDSFLSMVNPVETWRNLRLLHAHYCTKYNFKEKKKIPQHCNFWELVGDQVWKQGRLSSGHFHI